MGPFALRVVLSCFCAAWVAASPAPQCSSELEDGTSLVQVALAAQMAQGELASEKCSTVDGTKTSLGAYTGKYEAFEFLGGQYFITDKMPHYKVDPAEPGGDLYNCSVKGGGGWGVDRAKCCGCGATDPLSATRAQMFKPPGVGSVAYTCYYDCVKVPDPPTTCAETEVTGDPHVTNLDGVRFNLVRTGTHEFLRLPRRTASGGEAAPLLEVLGRVEEERHCADGYVKELLVGGTWLQTSGGLTFRTGGSDPSGEGAIQLMVNGSNVSVEDLRVDSRLAGVLEKVAAPGTPRGVALEGKIRRLSLLTVRLRFPKAILTVEWLHRQVPGSSVNHLNFKVAGLPRPESMEVGGILGRDDHTLAATAADDCHSAATADLIAASDPHSRADVRPLDVDDQEVISATYDVPDTES